MASDKQRFAKLNTSQQTPAPVLVPAPAAPTLSWQGTGFTQATQYYRFSALRKSANDTALWEGESLAGSEQTLAGAANKNNPRAVITPGADASGVRVYQSLTSGAEKLWAEIRLTRDGLGNITGATLQSPYDAGSIAATTATTVTWDGPSGQDQSAPGGNPSVPTVDTAHKDYVIAPDPTEAIFGNKLRGDGYRLGDGSEASSIHGFQVELTFNPETTSGAQRKDWRKIVSYRMVRIWLLPETYPTVFHDSNLSEYSEEPRAQWESGPWRHMIRFLGTKLTAEPVEPVTT